MRVHKSRSQTIIVCLLILFFILLVAVGAFLILQPASPQQIEARFQVEGLDPNAITGTPSEAPRKETSPGEGMFSCRLDTSPTFGTDGIGQMLLQNPAFNEYLMLLELTDETGQVICRSGYLAPNQYLEIVQLQKPLDMGTYQGTAYINAIDPETLQYVDAFTVPVTIQVENTVYHKEPASDI